MKIKDFSGVDQQKAIVFALEKINFNYWRFCRCLEKLAKINRVVYDKVVVGESGYQNPTKAKRALIITISEQEFSRSHSNPEN